MIYPTVVIAAMWASIALAYGLSLIAEDHHCLNTQRHALAYVDACFKPCMVVSVAFIIVSVLIDMKVENVVPLHP